MRGLTVSVLTIDNELRICSPRFIATKTNIAVLIFLQLEKLVSRTNSFRNSINREEYPWNESSAKMCLTNSQLNDQHRYLQNRATRYPIITNRFRTYYNVSRADNVLYAARNFILQTDIPTSSRSSLALCSCNRLVQMGRISIIDCDRYRQIEDNRNCLVYISSASRSWSTAWNRADVVLIDRS